MVKDRLQGKLAVILHADIAQSTRLVQLDEELAHQRIRARFERCGAIIASYHGRVRELRGDALLAEFERASDAVSAALSFQSEQREYLQGLDDEVRPEMRVGIALGEVISADNTLTGAGVVLAQRIEQLADPGGLCITSAIHEALPERMPFELQSLGDRALKGFDQRVRVYRVRLTPGQGIPPPRQQRGSSGSASNRRRGIALAAVVLLAVAGAVSWSWFSAPREQPASLAAMAFPLPDKPSIAVLPFANMSDDASQDYFADGITEDLITDLSKVSGLFVIARNSTFSYKGQAVKVRQVSEELGVRYVLEGSVRRAGDRVRINAQLVDATSGGHLWAERYDGSLEDIFALQDKVTTQIVAALSVTLTPREKQKVASSGTASAAAHDAFLQGLSFYLRNTPADNARAESYFLSALEIDPEFKRAYAALAKVYFKGVEPEYSRALGIYWRKTVLLAYRNLATGADAEIPDLHVVRSQMALYKHQLEIALDEAERALAIRSNDVDAMKAKAKALIYAGDYKGGRALANRVMRHDPVAIAEPLYLIGLSHFAGGDYARAAEFLERALDSDPDTSLYTRLLAAAYGKLGRQPEAGEAWSRFRKNWHWPVWIAAEIIFHPFADGEVLEHLAAGLKAAGVAERPPMQFVKLGRDNRLSGEEIRTLLFGATIAGTDFWVDTAWKQRRDAGGKLTHTGPWFYTGNIARGEGESWVEGDRLCDKWYDEAGDVTICVTVFHDVARGDGSYFLFNDHGPHPFRVVVP